jgi:hypothetical protein
MGGYERLVSDGADGMRSLPAYLDISSSSRPTRSRA